MFFADTESVMWNSCGCPNKSSQVFDCCYWGWSGNTCSSEFYSYASTDKSLIATVVECLRFLVHKCCCIYALNIVDTCRLTAGTQGSALGQTLSNEYGNPLPFYLEVTQKWRSVCGAVCWHAPPLSIYFLIFCSLLPFSFFLFSSTLLIFSTVHPIPFYQNIPTPFPGVRS